MDALSRDCHLATKCRSAASVYSYETRRARARRLFPLDDAVGERRLGAIGGDGLLGLADNRVDDPVLECLGRAHPVVAIDVVRDALRGLAGVGSQELLHASLQSQQLARLNLDVGGGALEA